MPKRPRNYVRPVTLEDAIELLAKAGAKALGGGTHLLTGDIEADTVVDLQGLGLSSLDLLDYQLRVGGATPLTSILEFSAIQGESAALVQQAIQMAGANTFRNAATLGGVIASKAENSTLLALLLALEARVMVLNLEVIGEILVEDFLEAEEPLQSLITEVIIPWEDGAGHIAHVARTPKDEPIVSIVGWRTPDNQHRFAATGIADHPIRLHAAEEETERDAILTAAKHIVMHKGDFRGSLEYRREMVSVLLGRVLDQIGM